MNRIFGLETEYNAVMNIGGRIFPLPENDVPPIIMALRGAKYISETQEAQRNLDLIASKLKFLISDGNIWFSNGGKLYFDLSTVPEYCTPECLSIKDLIAHDKAGEKMLYLIFKIMRIGDGEISLSKDNFNEEGKFDEGIFHERSCTGCHENYSITFTSDEISGGGKSDSNDILKNNFFHKETRGGEKYVMQNLWSFLATRQIFAGAGYLGFDGVNGKRFLISGRSAIISQKEGINSNRTERSLVCLKDENLSWRNHRRIHLSCGDSNMSEISTFLKIGTAHLILRLLQESRKSDKWIINYPKLNFPLEVLRAVAKDLDFRNKYELISGHKSFKALGAIDIQKHFKDAAADFLEKNGGSEEEWRVVKLWDKVLGLLESNSDELSEMLDYKIKLKLFDLYLAKHKCRWDEITVKTAGKNLMIDRLRALDFSYHDISPVGLYNQLIQKNRIKRLVADSEIDSDMLNPPPDTRANMRGNFVKELLKSGINPNPRTDISWERLLIQYAEETAEFCDLGDPFASITGKFEEIIRKIKEKGGQ